MIRNLHLYLILLIAYTAFSQTSELTNKSLPLYNMYYLSKYITAKNLTTPQVNQVYNSLINSIGIAAVNDIKNKYKTPPDGVAETNPIGAFVNNREVTIQQLKSTIITELCAGYFERIEGSDKKTWQGKFDGIKLTINDTILIIKKVAILEDLKKKYIVAGAEINLKENNAELLNPDKETIQQSDIQSNLDNYKTKLKQIKAYIKETNTFADGYINKQDLSNYDIKLSNFNDAKSATTEIQINSIIQTAEQRAASASFNIPSESDMINAMAIFLAKRAQQETVIWFMDQLRMSLDNPLIYEAFPETIKLIESLEDFNAPNFSIEWRYAISSDFIKMPKNLAEGNWVKNIVFKNDPKKAAVFITCIDFAYDLNRLISEKYNYRDIIRYFYTRPNLQNDINSKSEIYKTINTSISTLYILTNELFAVDQQQEKENFRLLSYEEINGLTKLQWIALGQLIKGKYGSKFENQKNFFEKDFPENQENLSKWIGNILISLSQFDKVSKDFQKALDGKTDLSNYSFYNVWQIISQIIDNIDYNRYLNRETVTGKIDTKLIKECLDIYDHIQNKNFASAIKETINIMDKVSVFDTNYLLEKLKVNDSIDVIFEKENLILKIKEKEYSFLRKDNSLLIYDQKKILDSLEGYSQYSPFLRFVKDLSKDKNYGVINEIYPGLDKKLTKIANQLKIKPTDLLQILKIESFYEIKGYNQEKLVVFLKTKVTSIQNNNQEKNISSIREIQNTSQKKLFKLASFFGDVLSAKNEQDLANVIDSHALPPTSYKLKRRVRQSIDLNGYVGIQGSRLLTNGETSLKQQFTGGITAPIGFSFTWSTTGPKPENLGFTIDVVDLGNIVNHYLVSSTTDYPKDVHFSEVFSPAASLIYGIRKTPFVVFTSVKFLPLKTSKSESDPNILINNKTFDATVFSVGIKIDIPLVNLYTRLK